MEVLLAQTVGGAGAKTREKGPSSEPQNSNTITSTNDSNSTSTHTTHAATTTTTTAIKNTKSNYADCEDMVGMKREMTLFDSTIMLIGITSGSGIFISANGVLQYSGSVGFSLLVWAISGLISLVGAFVYTELATMIPSSGGPYTYIMAAFGRAPAFVYLWMNLFLEEANMLAIDSITFGTYILLPFFPDSQTPPDIPVRLLAACLILFLAWLNICSVRASVILQNILMFPKILIIGAILVVGFYRLAVSPSSSFNDPFANTSVDVPTITTAFYQALFTYNGWESITCVVEEVKHPNRTVLLAMSISLIILTIVYILVNVAYFAVLTPDEVLFSPAVAVTFGRVAFGVMAWIVPVFVAISTVGSSNGKTHTQSRVVLVGARHGQLPASLALVGKRCTPVTAIMFMTSFALLYLVTVDLYALINVVSFSSTLSQVAIVSGLLWLRHKRPHWKRPFRVWTFVAVVYLMMLVALVVLPLLAEPVTIGITISLIFLALIIYYLFLFRPITSKAYLQGCRRFNRFVQIVFEVRPESDYIKLL